MLLLTRRAGEEILIDKGQIKVKVISERNGQVMLGIHAPVGVDIDRKEIFLRKRANPIDKITPVKTDSEKDGVVL